jgi:hypothetical protein
MGLDKISHDSEDLAFVLALVKRCELSLLCIWLNHLLLQLDYLLVFSRLKRYWMVIMFLLGSNVDHLSIAMAATQCPQGMHIYWEEFILQPQPDPNGLMFKKLLRHLTTK